MKEGARVFHDCDQIVKNETEYVLNFNSVRYDTDNIHDPKENTRLTCRTAGIYLICCHIIWGRLPCEGFRQLAIKFNGVKNIATDRGVDYGKWSAYNNCTTLWKMEVGDCVEAVVFHSSFALSSMETSIKALLVRRAQHLDSPEFMMQRIG